MNEQYDNGQNNHQYGAGQQYPGQSGMWRPPVPTPYVTHQDMGPLHSRMGALEQGQASIMSTYNHLRGDMITHFDKIEKILEAQKPQEQSGVNLTVRELVLIVVALVLAGGILSRLPGISQFMS